MDDDKIMDCTAPPAPRTRVRWILCICQVLGKRKQYEYLHVTQGRKGVNFVQNLKDISLTIVFWAQRRLNMADPCPRHLRLLLRRVVVIIVCHYKIKSNRPPALFISAEGTNPYGGLVWAFSKTKKPIRCLFRPVWVFLHEPI
jgi:hypothetical protein